MSLTDATDLQEFTLMINLKKYIYSISESLKSEALMECTVIDSLEISLRVKRYLLKRVQNVFYYDYFMCNRIERTGQNYI